MSTPKTQPFLSPGRQTWNAPVTNWQGKRSNKSLGTKDVSEARAICRELNDLAKSQLLPDDTALSLVSPIAYKLYYDREKFIRLSGDAAPITSPLNRDEANEMLAELVDLRKQVKELQGFKEKYDALVKSVEGRRIESSRNSPTLGECVEPYAQDYKDLSPKQASAHKLFLKQFIKALKENTKVADVRPAQILDFIKADAENASDDPKKPARKRDPRRPIRMRAIVSRFFTWAVRQYEIPSPMDQVPTIRIAATRDIEWHSLEQVQTVIGKLDFYWSAVVAVMAFAGLSAHEVRGLRRKDIQVVKGRRILRITPTDERGLKTSARQRSVLISDRLAPLLDELIASQDKIRSEAESKIDEKKRLTQDAIKELLIFPSLGKDGGIWKQDYFSSCLNTWLPEGMTALSLRRTFGSLLIRSGKSEEEVAAAMGNSATMVRQHYARILGGEVDLNF